ncbi:twin-arginine translocation signal domain-containing protein [Brucella oryzae]|uniref:Uncharacterized protein n=1 Tax=Brucella oryzae TaxID=335286 RepID=A0A2S7IW72_9HYPH|nr:twin-arginine translocation signal domain-containing protein [Brucella oryzae]PQA72208.1 hypothetical protein C3731_17565 [Brucella oryzae]
MNRRRFLSFLGLAPVAAAVPAMALPRVDSPLATGGVVNVKVKYHVGERGPETVLPLANIGSITAGTLRTSNGIEMDMQSGNVRFTV